MSDDMSTVNGAAKAADEGKDQRFDIQSRALPMITFISNRLVSGVAAPLREFVGVSVNEARVILLINEGAISTAAEAVRIIGIDQAAVSRSVQRLIRRGFVVSEIDKGHAKRNLLALTPEGATYAKAIWRLNEERENRFLSVLTPAERIVALDILARLLANVEATNDEVPQEEWLND